jgi:hypothetical protein
MQGIKNNLIVSKPKKFFEFFFVNGYFALKGLQKKKNQYLKFPKKFIFFPKKFKNQIHENFFKIFSAFCLGSE